MWGRGERGERGEGERVRMVRGEREVRGEGEGRCGGVTGVREGEKGCV